MNGGIAQIAPNFDSALLSVDSGEYDFAIYEVGTRDHCKFVVVSEPPSTLLNGIEPKENSLISDEMRQLPGFKMLEPEHKGMRVFHIYSVSVSSTVLAETIYNSVSWSM